MYWMILEALAAGAVLVFIVWWTMFSGRPQGERLADESAQDTGAPLAPTPPPGAAAAPDGQRADSPMPPPKA